MKKNKEKKLAELKKNATSMTPLTDNVKAIAEIHKLAAFHNTEAARYHIEAARHYEEGNDEKAAYNALLAHGHNSIAGQFINDDAKHHAQLLKHTVFQK